MKSSRLRRCKMCIRDSLQAVREVLESIQPVVEKHPEYEKAALIERLVEPEQIGRAHV